MQGRVLLSNSFDQQIIQHATQDNAAFPFGVTVGHIRKLFENGLTNERNIRQVHPEIKPRTVALGRAFLMAADPEGYKRLCSSPGPYKILLDENLAPADVSAGTWSILGHPIHAHHVGLIGHGDSGKGDKGILDYAMNNGIDAILTTDCKYHDEEMDLCGIQIARARDILNRMDERQEEVVDIEHLPVVIGFKVPGQLKTSPEVFKLIAKHKGEVLSYLETRTSPCILVRDSGVRPIKTYTELYAMMMVERHNDTDVIRRRDIWVAQWMERILRVSPKTRYKKLSDFEALEARVRAAAAICEMSVKDGSAPDSDFDDLPNGQAPMPTDPRL